MYRPRRLDWNMTIPQNEIAINYMMPENTVLILNWVYNKIINSIFFKKASEEGKIALIL